VCILEHRLGAQGPTLGPAIIDQHPVVVELRRRLAQTEVELVDKDRTISSLQDDVEVLRETNRSLVREYGHGRTDTKSPMVHSWMVHVAGGEAGSTRHEHDGLSAPSGGSRCRRNGGFTMTRSPRSSI
jgi:hypothetical protein